MTYGRGAITNSRVPDSLPSRPRFGNCFSEERAAWYNFCTVGPRNERWRPPNRCENPLRSLAAPGDQRMRISGLQHPLDAGVYFFFLDEFAVIELVDANPYLIFEPLVIG